MTVKTFNDRDEIERELNFNVPVRRNMISRYTGSLFDNSANATFNINLLSPDEWETKEYSF